MHYALGLDYGTNSVRALIVATADGKEIATAVVPYPGGRQGVLLDPKNHLLARQHPGDYLFGLEQCIGQAISLAQTQEAHSGFSPDRIIGIGVGTTGSSPLPVDARNVPLALDPQWRENLAAQCWLWKDHTSHWEAAEITRLAALHRPRYIAKCGNTYSSEWFWSKIWHCQRTAPEVFAAAHSWIELADYIPSVLAGIADPREVRRGICAAGHKALYSDEWGGLPDREFLALLDPSLAALRDRIDAKAHDATQPAGTLCPVWAEKLGLPAGIPIAIGELDVHYGAIGSGIEEGTLVKAIGTSTCDCAVVPATKQVADIPGICGIVPGAILPGHHGIEAGQSAVGDIFKWFVEGFCKGNDALYASLASEAAALRPGQSGLLALDWNNGNRTVLVDPMLTGLLVGQTLYTTPAEVYRALIEGTAFGARVIIERLRQYGVPVGRIVCCGGIAEKNPLLMQIYADVTGCAMQVAGSGQACALGAAVAAAVLAGPAKGGHADFPAAQRAMTSVKPFSYLPDPAHAAAYDHLYALYLRLHDAFGGVAPGVDLSTVMKELISLKNSANQANQ
ncbi:L-ribulokinase [Verrucomicrobium sp. GAS474]|uniref:ribulokinase n=1 Tax=Verrucomicrobium sp. GAS474 TaxID=1882831 RepID=UPI00087D82D2|nr:ribulokinase [Verrucomicrobium sp. GAS474]SDU30804.1 L-ribulokinase [Verrucomicrobium sp. GAS474]